MKQKIGVNHKAFVKKHLLTNLSLFLVLFALLTSFFYGWYLDGSKTTGGMGWADQKSYRLLVDKFAGGNLPSPEEMHFTIGYPILGAIVKIINIPTDPFMIVSLVLLMASAIFCYLAVRHLFGARWAVTYIILLFAWDGVARSFQFASDLFAVPWNNQVLFFTFAYYFWLLVVKSKKKTSWRLVIITGIISGFCFLSREETIIFIVPLVSVFLYISKADWRKWLVSYGLITLCYVPQLVIKYAVLGSATNSGRSDAYGQVIKSQYLKPRLLYRNAIETIIDSSYFGQKLVRRPALLQAAPWLWLSPIGIGIGLLSKKYSKGLKVFMLAGCAIIVFYLSGANMSAQKLKFHCLRYISPGFIVLNLGVIIVAREGLYYITNSTNKTRNSRREQRI